MKAPAFWTENPPGALARALEPLGRCYMAATARRLRQPPAYRAPVPVACIGNLTAGGAGKTPVVIDLAQRLRAAGVEVHILTRGYGGSARGPLQVDPGRHEASAVGDEPLLLARAASTWVASDRAAGARAAAAAGAAALLMDDGFQNPALAKDVGVVVVDGRRGFGNGLGIPAGPLRESIAAGLARATAVVVMGEDRHGIAALVAAAGRPLLRARLVPDAAALSLRGRRVFAFAGIGDPAKFLATVAEAGADIAGHLAFPDHHAYRDADIVRILGRADILQAMPVTTEKDAVRLPAAVRDQVLTVPVQIAWEDEQGLHTLVVARLMEKR